MAKLKKANVTKKELTAALENINDVLEPDENWNTTGTHQEMVDEIRDAADEILPDDELDEATYTTLQKLGIFINRDEAFEEEPDEEEPDEEEPDEEDEAEEDEAEEEPKKKKPEPASKGKKSEPKKEKEKPEPKKSARKSGYVRLDAVCDALKKKHKTKSDLVKHANDLYEKNGGKRNDAETKYYLKLAAKVMSHSEKIEVSNFELD
jgi:outer membrane biosynthesis protein TonB